MPRLPEVPHPVPGVLTPSWRHPTSAKATPRLPVLCQVAHPMPGYPRADDRPTLLPPNFCQKPPRRVPTPCQGAQRAMLVVPNLWQSHLEMPTLTPGCSQRSPPPARVLLEVPTPRHGALGGPHPTPGCSRRCPTHAKVHMVGFLPIPEAPLVVPTPPQGSLEVAHPTGAPTHALPSPVLPMGQAQ